MPAQVNISVETDADFFQVFQYTQPDGITPINVNNATFVFGVRRSISDPNVLFKVTSVVGTVMLNGTSFPNGQIQIVDGPNGKFGLWIAMEQLQAAPQGIWSHSLIINQPPTSLFPPALFIPIWNGTLTINPGPSR